APCFRDLPSPLLSYAFSSSCSLSLSAPPSFPTRRSSDLMFATDVGLGVNNPSRTYLYLLIASPVGSYFSGGIQPVTVWLSTDYTDRKSTRLNSSHVSISYAVFCLKKKKKQKNNMHTIRRR